MACAAVSPTRLRDGWSYVLATRIPPSLGFSADAGKIRECCLRHMAHLDETITGEGVMGAPDAEYSPPLIAPNRTFTVTAHFGPIKALEPLPYPWDEAE